MCRHTVGMWACSCGACVLCGPWLGAVFEVRAGCGVGWEDRMGGEDFKAATVGGLGWLGSREDRENLAADFLGDGGFQFLLWCCCDLLGDAVAEHEVVVGSVGCVDSVVLGRAVFAGNHHVGHSMDDDEGGHPGVVSRFGFQALYGDLED